MDPQPRVDGTVFNMTIPVPRALIQITLFLGSLTFMYISARVVGDAEYRSRFLDPLIDLKLSLLARNRYRNKLPRKQVGVGGTPLQAGGTPTGCGGVPPPAKARRPD